MSERLAFLRPEILLFVATCLVMVVGLSKTYATRRLTSGIAGLALLGAFYLSIATTPSLTSAACPISGKVFSEPVSAASGQLLLPAMVPFMKATIAAVGLLLLLVQAGTVDRAEEAAIAAGKRTFDPLRTNRAEYYAFFLFSLTGLMLCASADSLIWLFLALELTSLPTYIMVAISTARNRGREAGVKYFFLGALGAAVFLYGFALIYGGTGQTNLNQIALAIRGNGLSTITLAGVMISLIGLGFKIAAVPMHFYTPDVYEGAAPQVSGFLAFVPKTAGFIAILLLCAMVGWNYAPPGADEPSALTGVITQSPWGTSLPEPVSLLLWVMAALTMTVGNVLALLQSSVKRVLAYSSIAHSGYMLVGVVAGPNTQASNELPSFASAFTRSGVSAVLFYLLCYGVMNLGAFAVLAAVERTPGADGEAREVDKFEDIRGLCRRDPVMGWCMVLCALSLLGLPPLLGFFGKLPLFTSGIAAGQVALVVILGLNSAIAAFYYLRLAFAPFLESPEEHVERTVPAPYATRRWAAVLSAASVVALAIFGSVLMREAARASTVQRIAPADVRTPASVRLEAGGSASTPPARHSSLLP
jgi:NADH-quinone oxidoreductase subunit N